MMHVPHMTQFVHQQIAEDLGTLETAELFRLMVPRVEQLPQRVRCAPPQARSNHDQRQLRQLRSSGYNIRSTSQPRSAYCKTSSAPFALHSASSPRPSCPTGRDTRTLAGAATASRRQSHTSSAASSMLAGNRRRVGRWQPALLPFDPGTIARNEAGNRARPRASRHHDLDLTVTIDARRQAPGATAHAPCHPPAAGTASHSPLPLHDAASPPPACYSLSRGHHIRHAAPPLITAGTFDPWNLIDIGINLTHDSFDHDRPSRMKQVRAKQAWCR